uniref:Uncharacterized protein n=1 Tax=Theropithecus gelada TaxID=9565 RepID=A0A8D2EYK5_THEGE
MLFIITSICDISYCKTTAGLLLNSLVIVFRLDMLPTLVINNITKYNVFLGRHCIKCIMPWLLLR